MKNVFIILAIALAFYAGLSVQGVKKFGDSALPNLFNSATNASVSISSATSTKVLNLNGIRQFAEICNASSSITYLSLSSPAATTSGMILTQNSCFEINNTKGFTGQINAIASAGTTTLTTIEK